MREADLQLQIIDYLTFRGIFAFPTHGPRNKPITPGIPDILGVGKDGRFIAIEVKTEDGIVSEIQEAFMRRLYKQGAQVVVARSLEDVQEAGL